MSTITNKVKHSAGMVEKNTIGAILTQIMLMLIVFVLAFICIIPMWHVLMSSISDGFELMSHKGLVLFPIGKPTIEGYKLIFKDLGVITGYSVTRRAKAYRNGEITANRNQQNKNNKPAPCRK